jgi:broad specificity phosphatase PhoE
LFHVRDHLVANYGIHMSSSGELWLVRHGETEWTISGAHTSRTDLPLTADGEQRARVLGKMIPQLRNGTPFALLLSSPLRRALDTAHLAGYQPESTTDLREWDYGAYEGLTTTEIQKDAPGWTIWTGTPPNGETAAQIATRADRVIERAIFADCDVAIFGHGHMLRVLASRWLGLDAAAGRFFALAPGSLSILGHERDARVIRLWDSTIQIG